MLMMLFRKLQLQLTRQHNWVANLVNVDKCPKAPSTASSIERFHQRTWSLLKDLVHASVSRTADERMTLVHHWSVDTSWLRTTWLTIVGLAVALWDLFHWNTTNLNAANRYIHLYTKTQHVPTFKLKSFGLRWSTAITDQLVREWCKFDYTDSLESTTFTFICRLCLLIIHETHILITITEIKGIKNAII